MTYETIEFWLQNVIGGVGALLLTVFSTFGSLAVSLPDRSMVATTTATVIRVIDGDTIVVTMAGQTETVRYIGIDTPEPYAKAVPECGSAAATRYNQTLVAEKTVRLVADVEDRDSYGRLLRYVYVGEESDQIFVNEHLVRSGFARPLKIPPNLHFADDFQTLFAEAYRDKVGIWAECDPE